MPKFSVVMPAYNCADYIAEAIRSVIKQTNQDFELLVIDDGSTDNTRAVVQKYRDAGASRISYIFQENKGEGAARNKGIAQASGEYVAFLDADDIWRPRKLELQNYDLGSCNKEGTVIFSDAFTFGEHGIITQSMFKERTPYPGMVHGHLLKENFVITQTVVVKKDCFAKVGYFREGMKYCTDFEMWLRLSRHYSFYYSDKVLAGYRIHARNTSSDIEGMRDAHIALIKEEIKNEGIDPCLSRSIFALQYFKHGYNFWDKGRPQEARQDFLRSYALKKTNKTFCYLLLTLLPFHVIKLLRQMKRALALFG